MPGITRFGGYERAAASGVTEPVDHPGPADSGRAGDATGVATASLALGDLLLRPWREGDAMALWAACQDPEIARWISIPQPFQPADAAEQIAE